MSHFSSLLVRGSILAGAVLGLAIMTGCTAQVPLHTMVEEAQVKEFKAPSEGKAGLYIYRKDEYVGRALYKDLYVDGVCLGETAPGVFFYKEVEGDQEHVLSTESEFSPNDLKVFTKSGKNYFFEQIIKFGVFVGGARLEQADEIKGKAMVTISRQAIPGTCSNQ